MNTLTAPTPSLPQSAPAAARSVLRLLQQLRHGTLTMQLPNGDTRCFGNGEMPHAAMTLKNWNVCAAALSSGDIGFAESYIAGDWTTPNLTALIRVLVRNRREVEDVIHGTWAGRLVYRAAAPAAPQQPGQQPQEHPRPLRPGQCLLRALAGRHDELLVGLVRGRPEPAHANAQHAKVRRALRMAGVQPGDRVLEIGCGWGALAEMATTEFQASSPASRCPLSSWPLLRQRMARLGTQDQADLRLQDYRDIQDAPFDAICSIEMVEAVGREYWPTYFQRFTGC